jgi:hypothetical protein
MVLLVELAAAVQVVVVLAYLPTTEQQEQRIQAAVGAVRAALHRRMLAATAAPVL